MAEAECTAIRLAYRHADGGQPAGFENQLTIRETIALGSTPATELAHRTKTVN